MFRQPDGKTKEVVVNSTFKKLCGIANSVSGHPYCLQELKLWEQEQIVPFSFSHWNGTGQTMEKLQDDQIAAVIKMLRLGIVLQSYVYQP